MIAAVATAQKSPNPKEAEKKANQEKTEKRGRPCIWKPQKLSQEDTSTMEELTTVYGRDEDQHSAFIENYDLFCTVNELKPDARKTLLLAIAQARRFGMAPGSVKTAVHSLLNKREFERGCRAYVISLLETAHTHSFPVQPRVAEWDDDLLLRTVQKEVLTGKTRIQDEVLMWFTALTGNRPCDVARLYVHQITIGPQETVIDWWLRKAQRKYHQRKTGQVYPYEWSCAPSERVKKYIKERDGKKLILDAVPRYRKKRVAGTVNTILKRTNKNWTSFIFRDRLDEILRAAGKSDCEIKALLDHSVDTSGAYYAKTATTKKIAAETILEREKKKTAKKAVTAAPKRKKAVAK